MAKYDAPFQSDYDNYQKMIMGYGDVAPLCRSRTRADNAQRTRAVIAMQHRCRSVRAHSMGRSTIAFHLLIALRACPAVTRSKADAQRMVTALKAYADAVSSYRRSEPSHLTNDPDIG